MLRKSCTHSEGFNLSSEGKSGTKVHIYKRFSLFSIRNTIKKKRISPLLELLFPWCKYSLSLLIYSNTGYYSNNKWQALCYFEITHIMVHIMSSETQVMCYFILTNAPKCLLLWIKISACKLTLKCTLCNSIWMLGFTTLILNLCHLLLVLLLSILWHFFKANWKTPVDLISPLN